MKTKVITLLVLISILYACGNKEVPFQRIIKNGEAQGSYYAVTYYDSLNRDFGLEIDSLLKAFDKSCSNYQPNSIISKVNRNEQVVLDSLFIGNFNMAQEVAQETQGDFDITVRPLVELWGFGLKHSDSVSSQQVDSIMQFVGYRNVKIDSGRVIKTDPRIMIDYNAIAQGYSVDVISHFLESKGVKYFLVDIGGELYAHNTKYGGLPWKVGIERPKDGEAYGENLSAILSLNNKGLATSGNYRKYYIKDGIKYAHTINPHNGYPVQHSLLSATVVAPSAALADAYATAFMVMGVTKAQLILKRHPNLDAFLIYADTDGKFRAFVSPGFNDLLEENSIQ